MCYIFKENEITPIQAEEDIPVLKVGYLSSSDSFISINQGAHYQFGIERRAEKFWEQLVVSPFDEEYITRSGLYSIEAEDEAKKYLDNVIRYTIFPSIFKARIFKAYIPKGSHYLKTDYGSYISDGLVVINKTLDYYPKLSKKFWDLKGKKVKPYVPENSIPGSE